MTNDWADMSGYAYAREKKKHCMRTTGARDLREQARVLRRRTCQTCAFAKAGELPEKVVVDFAEAP